MQLNTLIQKQQERFIESYNSLNKNSKMDFSDIRIELKSLMLQNAREIVESQIK